MKKRKSFKDCIVKPGEKSPYANLLVDLAFKKAFREIAKRMISAGKLSDEKIAEYSGLSVEDIVVLRSQLENN